MKRHISVPCLMVILALANLAFAQSRVPRDYPRYEVIDLGTFGGPNGNATAGAISISRDGTITSASDTSQRVSCAQHPINFWETTECYALHGFRWKDGTLSDLGTLGGDDSFGFWINNHDEIAGVAEDGTIDPDTGFFNQRAALWQNGSIADLGSFGGPQSFAFAINDRGQVAGAANTAVLDPFSLFSAFFPTNRETHAFLWEDGTLRDIGTLGGPDAMGLLLNNRGDVAGISFTDYTVRDNLGTPAVHGFVWRDGKMHDVGTFGGDFSYVNFLNSRGQAAGYANLAGDTAAHAFLWDRGSLRDLGTLGGSSSLASWISDNGHVVGQAWLKGDQQFHAFSWMNGHMRDLGTLDGDGCSYAYINNSSGEVVGISGDCSFQTTRQFYARRNGPMVDMDNLIVRGPRISVIQPVYISGKGEIIELAGFENGELRTVMLRPTEDREGDGKDHHSPMSGKERAQALEKIKRSPLGLLGAQGSRHFGR
jgi:probable HAF family extracellular repeat protein